MKQQLKFTGLHEKPGDEGLFDVPEGWRLHSVVSMERSAVSGGWLLRALLAREVATS